jgi:hypothetical protein
MVADSASAAIKDPASAFPGYHDRMAADERALVDDHLAWNLPLSTARHALIGGDLRTYRESVAELVGDGEPGNLDRSRLTSLVRLAAIDVEFAAGGFSPAMLERLVFAAESARGPSSGRTIAEITGPSWVLLTRTSSLAVALDPGVRRDFPDFLARSLVAIQDRDVAVLEALPEDGMDRVRRFSSDPCTHLDAARAAIMVVRLLDVARTMRDDIRDVSGMLDAASDARQFASLLDYPIVWIAAARASAIAYWRAAAADPEDWRAPGWLALAARNEMLAQEAFRLQ